MTSLVTRFYHVYGETFVPSLCVLVMRALRADLNLVFLHTFSSSSECKADRPFNTTTQHVQQSKSCTPTSVVSSVALALL
jgi:hypothetical protein